jgi:hypothetical protein
VRPVFSVRYGRSGSLPARQAVHDVQPDVRPDGIECAKQTPIPARSLTGWVVRRRLPWRMTYSDRAQAMGSDTSDNDETRAGMSRRPGLSRRPKPVPSRLSGQPIGTTHADVRIWNRYSLRSARGGPRRIKLPEGKAPPLVSPERFGRCACVRSSRIARPSSTTDSSGHDNWGRADRSVPVRTGASHR